MTSLIILILIGGACLAVTAWALWSTPATRDYLRRIFGSGRGR